MGNSFTLLALSLPSSSTARIEVEATDGFSTTSFFKVALLPHNALSKGKCVARLASGGAQEAPAEHPLVPTRGEQAFF